MSCTVLVDTTVWVNFALVEELELLTRLPDLAVTPEVIREAHRGKIDLDVCVASGQAALLQMESYAELATYAALRKPPGALGEGEAAILAIASARGLIAATDDGTARKRAARLKPPVTLSDTLGLLRRLLETPDLERERAEQILDEIRTKGGFLPDIDL